MFRARTRESFCFRAVLWGCCLFCLYGGVDLCAVFPVAYLVCKLVRPGRAWGAVSVLWAWVSLTGSSVLSESGVVIT